MQTKVCSRCKVEKPISDFSPRHDKGKSPTTKSWCKECMNAYARSKAHALGVNAPMDQDRYCPQFLGVHVAERILSHYFDGITRMPLNNPGYDFICKNGYKIDVKSSCRRYEKNRWSPRWVFDIRFNTVADYFLCLAFDDRVNLYPLHIWLIPGDEVSHTKCVAIGDTLYGLNKWSRFERPLERVIECCDSFRTLV